MYDATKLSSVNVLTHRGKADGSFAPQSNWHKGNLQNKIQRTQNNEGHGA